MQSQVLQFRGEFSESGFKSFMQDLKVQHLNEMEAGTVAEYELFQRKFDDGSQVIILPSQIMNLVDRMPQWREETKCCEVEPDLSVFKRILLR